MKRCFPVLGLAVLALSASPVLAASGPLSADANAAYLAANARKPGVRVLPDGLQYRVLHFGSGKRPGPQDAVTVYYALSLIDGDKIQGTEVEFPAQLQVNGVIAGWREALMLMREGDHWTLVVPSSLGYGAAGNDDVPPNQTLVFDIELLKTEAPKPEAQSDDSGQPGAPPDQH